MSDSMVSSPQAYQDYLAIVNAIIPALSTSDEVTVVSKKYSNDTLNSYKEEYSSKYPRLCGRDWTYYLMKPQITIGRDTDDFIQQQLYKRSPGPHSADIDLGPVKIVSRVHAIIKYDEPNKTWELEVRGRNGAKLNGAKIRPKRSPLGRISLELNSGDIIEIAGIQMIFILPDTPPVISENCLLGLISELVKRDSDTITDLGANSISLLRSILERIKSEQDKDEDKNDSSSNNSNNNSNGIAGVSELVRKLDEKNSQVVTSQVADGQLKEASNLDEPFQGSQQDLTPSQLEGKLAVRIDKTHNGSSGIQETNKFSLSIPSSKQYRRRTLDIPVISPDLASSTPPSTSPTASPNRDTNTSSSLKAVTKHSLLRDEKPPAPYSSLITKAILSKPYGVISVSEIYEFLYTKYDYFRRIKTGWRNSVRHNLSVNPAFEKIPRSMTPIGGKGMVWRINKKYQDEFLRRWRNGTISLKNAKTISVDRQLQLYLSRHDKLPSLADE